MGLFHLAGSLPFRPVVQSLVMLHLGQARWYAWCFMRTSNVSILRFSRF